MVISTNTTGQAVTCTATDNAGNQTTSNPVTIKRDNQAPTGSITAPDNGDAITGTFNVTSNSADAVSGVASAKFEYSISGNNTWTQIGALDTATPYQASWNTTGLADGNYDIRVTTTDNAGNAFTSPNITINIDRTPPTVSITFPANPQYGADAWNCRLPGGTGDICGTASDGFGSVTDVTVTVRRNERPQPVLERHRRHEQPNGQPWTSTTAINLTATGTANWSRAFTTASLLNNGVTYTITAVATDSVGSVDDRDTARSPYLTTAPTAALTAPTSGT